MRQLGTLLLAAASFAGAQTFTNPILPHGADPSLVQWHGSFVSVQGCGEDGRPAICLRMAKELAGLKSHPQTVVWQAPQHGPNALDVWAPQIDVLGGDLYIYYAADAKGDNDHRLFALVPQDRSQPLGHWVEADTGAPGGQLRTDWKSVWAIDPDVFTAANGKLYLLYACRQDNSGTDYGRSQSICIAPMRDPLHLAVDPRTGHSVVELSQPRQSWERRGWPTQEGPFGFTHDGVDYILYSGSFSGNPDQYAEGMLVNDHPPQPEGWTDPLLNAAAWRKVGPIFDGHHAAYGTASSVLVPSADGDILWHVYHGTDCMTGCQRVAGKTWRDRSDRAQPAGWNSTGLVLGYPVDFRNTDGTGTDVPVSAAPEKWPTWGPAFGDAAEGNTTDGLVQVAWTHDSTSITSPATGLAQTFFQSNPNLQLYTISTHIKHLAGTGPFGIYAAYIGHANYSTVMFNGNTITTDALINGKPQGAKSCALPSPFDPAADHHLAVEVNNGALRILLDDTALQGDCQNRQFLLLAGQPPENGTNGQAGIRTENSSAQFTAFHIIDGAPTDTRKTNQFIALRNRGSRMNLDNGCAGGCKGKPKTDVAVLPVPPAAPYPSNISSTQLWQLRGNNDGTYAIASPLSTSCIEARDTEAIQESCSKGPQQAWWILPSGEGFTIVNKATNTALSSDNAHVTLQPRADTPAQRWTIVAQ